MKRDTKMVGRGRSFRNAKRAAEWLTREGFVVEESLGVIIRIGKGRLARAFTTVNPKGRAYVSIVEVKDEGVSPQGKPSLLGRTRKSPSTTGGPDDGNT